MAEEMTWTELVNDGNTPKVEPKPWMRKRKFIRIESIEQLKKVVDQAIEAGHCALDLETTGLDNRIDQSGKTKNDIVGYCLAFNANTGYYAPVGHVYTDQGDNSEPHPANIDDRGAALEIKRLCKNCVTIYHNSPFDLEFLRGLGHQYGFEVDDPDMIEDTLILDYLKDSTQKRHGLKYLSKEYLGWEMIELKDLFMGDDLNFAKLDPTADETLWYACPDAICTWALFQWYRFHDYKGRKPAISEYPAVINEQKEIYQIEKSLVPALRWMERNRPKVDRQYTHSILKEAEEYQNELVRDIEKEFCQEIKRDDGVALFLDEDGEPKYEVFRNTFEVTSPAQLGKAMEALKENNSAFANVELEYTEKSDQVRTDNDYIEYLAKRYGDRFPLFQKIQNYRSLQKAVSTYIKPIHQNTDHDEYNPETEKTGNENLDQKIQDNTIRFRFRACKVDTGRFAADKGRPEFGSSGINVQSTPACYNYAKFQTRKINSRPEGEGDPDAELAKGYVQAKQNTDFLKRVHDNHFVTDNKTGDEHCIRENCEGCPFIEECNHEEPSKKMFYSLEAAVRPSIRARDGYVMVAIDYASLELRVAANICEEPKWLEEYYRCGNCSHEFEQPEKQPDGTWILKEKPSARCPECGSDKIGDLHTLTAKIIYGDEVTDLPPSEFKQKRQDGKGTNFAIIYMGGPSTIARNLGVSFERGKEIRNAVFDRLNTFSKWITRTVAKAELDEMVTTTSGRKVRLNDINHEEKWIREKQKRNAVNSIVQGSATGDLIKYAMGEIYKQMRDRDWMDDCHMLLTMHDELVFEIKKDKLDDILPVIDHCMTKYADEKKWSIPLVTDVEIGQDWGARYDWREMHNTFVENGIAADPVPQFLVNHIKFEEGMWYKDESTEEKQIWDGASFVSEEKFLGTEEDTEKSDNSIEEDTEMSDNSDTSKADEEGQKLVKDFTEADMPENHTEYDIHDHTIYNALATDREQLSFEVSLGKIKRASKALEVLGMGKRTHALRIVSATGNILVNPNQRLILVNPEIFEILAFYEGL